MNSKAYATHANWTATAASLPGEGSVVEFVLDSRECPLRGIYTLGRFESRWTYYPPTTVRQWRTTSSTECVPEPIARGFSFARARA